MKTEQARKIFEETGNCNTPDSVANVSGAAGDNAADTIGWANRYGSDGKHTDEFIEHWRRSVESILCNSDSDPEAAAWFEVRGVKY